MRSSRRSVPVAWAKCTALATLAVIAPSRLKFFPLIFQPSSELKARFEPEARAISSLNHPHICHLYDIGSQDGAAFLVMEYLEGETLADRLHKNPLPLKQVLEVAVQITEALATAHHAGILHRDLKPGNVMLPRRRRQVAGFFRVVASLQGGAGTARSCSSSIPPTT